MTRVFRNRAEAEKAGAKWSISAEDWSPETWGGRIVGAWRVNGEIAIVRTDLEAQLAEALEAVEWEGEQFGGVCPFCGGAGKHEDACKLSLALRAFRGETK